MKKYLGFLMSTTIICFVSNVKLLGQVNKSVNSDKDLILNVTQKLLDGIATGDTSVWIKYLDDSCVITSEDGSVTTKKDFIKVINRPPAGYKKTETIISPIFKFHGNVVVFSYTAGLTLELYGQKRFNEICETDTWIKTKDGWRLIAEEALDKPNFPVAQKSTEKIINEITGKYQLNENFGFNIFLDSDRLYMQQYGGKKNELVCESDFVYFRNGSPLLRCLFVHDKDDKITQLIFRRAGSDFIIPKLN
jgi:Domain of unknown function (DUF4440)